MAAADKMRDRFGESAVSLAASMRGKFRERTHEIQWVCRERRRRRVAGRTPHIRTLRAEFAPEPKRERIEPKGRYQQALN